MDKEKSLVEQSVVIVGASHAAAECVTQLRRSGWAGRIVLIGDEDSLPYQRPPLSKAYFKGEIEPQKLLIKPQETYDKAECDIRLNTRVSRIDRQKKCVELDSGEPVEYTYLVLCTGTRARKLPVEGAAAENVFYLRTLTDVDKIRASINSGQHLLVVGAGYIGLEIAASAIKQGVDVTVLEAQERVLARVTGDHISDFYQRIHGEEGVNIRLNVGLDHFEHDSASSRAILANGEEIPFDHAIVGIGVLPNQELASEAGLQCDNGIVVNEYCQTDDESIYAIGDCCNHPNQLYQRRLRLESVPNAVEQAKVTASAICGERRVYDAIPWFWSDQYDVKLQTVGLFQGHDQVVVRGDLSGRKFSVLYFQKGRLIAIDAINSPAEFMVGKKLVAQQATPDLAQIGDVEVPIKSFVS
ncbi:MAG: FAD-dependent oxidoreductase [Pseudomonadota bacterium]